MWWRYGPTNFVWEKDIFDTMHKIKKDNKDRIPPDGLIQIHKEDCEEVKTFSDAIYHTNRVTLELIVTCLVHLSAEERISMLRY